MSEPTVFREHEAERDKQLAQFPGSVVIGSFRNVDEAESAKGKRPKDCLLTVIPFPDLSYLYLWTPWKHYPPRPTGSYENQINVVGGMTYWLNCPESAEEQLRGTLNEVAAQRARLATVRERAVA